jgi:hypothetical protein
MTTNQRTARIASIDIVRGAVMVLMAIDHVRVYSGIPAGGPSPGIFFTRWVTHFCAPAFVFFAGTSAYLYGKNIGDKSGPFDTAQGRLARFLVTRGLLLVLLELTLIRWLWTFRIDYSEFMLAGVIWMLGWCMVLMAGLVWLPTRAIAVFGLVTIFAQNLVGLLAGACRNLRAGSEVPLPRGRGQAWSERSHHERSVFHRAMDWRDGGWLCVWRGHDSRASGARQALSANRVVRNRALPRAWWPLSISEPGARQRAASPLPAKVEPAKSIRPAIVPVDDAGAHDRRVAACRRARGWMAHVLAVFGRVPMFYYLLHIPVIHIAALIVTFIREGSVHRTLRA